MKLTDEQIKKIVAAFVTFLFAVAAVFGYDFVVVQPREAARPVEVTMPAPQTAAPLPSAALPGLERDVLTGREYEQLIVRKELTADGTLQVNGNTSLAGTLGVMGASTLTGNVTMSGKQISGSQVITVTQSATITPTKGLVILASAGNLSFGAIAGGVAGQDLYLTNRSNTTITITDTGTLKLTGNIALTQYDGLYLKFDGTNWVQMAPVAAN